MMGCKRKLPIMLKVVSVASMRQIEADADAAGLSYDTMMQNAGRATAKRAMTVLENRPDARVTVLVGPGNNGGDGLVAGLILAHEGGAQVRFYLLNTRSEADANFKAVQDAGLFVALAESDHDFRVLRNMVASADVVLDALFGIGVRLPLKGEAEKVLRNVRQALGDTQQPVDEVGETITPSVPRNASPTSRPYVIAVDCPSGLECDTGELDKNAIPADETITFIAAKPGLFKFPGAGAVGLLHVATIGVPADLPALQKQSYEIADSKIVRDLLPSRSQDSNKGTFGKALVIAGSTNYVGAPGLAALAAYRTGTGLVTIGAPGPVVGALSGHFLEPTWLMLPHDLGVLAEAAAALIHSEMGSYDALLLGPGWGREAATRAMLVKLLTQQGETSKRRPIGFGREDKKTEASEENAAHFPPLVVDADGLNLLSEIEDWWQLLPPNTVITPHPGEMGRLAKLETSIVQAQRWELAVQKAAQWNVILLLKGAHTLIAEPSGKMVVLPFKTDALSTAGTGDVLAGIITGLLAQGLQPFDAAVVGGYLHGLAGEQAAKKQGSTRSVIAGDVLAALSEAISLVEKS
jgi:NAD(P)H-hydrate epimerase